VSFANSINVCLKKRQNGEKCLMLSMYIEIEKI